MRCKELEAVLEQEGLNPLPPEAQEHLAECPDCQDFFGDLSAIVVAAKQIPAEESPPDRVWISLRAQLAAEGIIREQAPLELAASIPWWQNLSQLFRPRMLASVGAGILVVLGSIYVTNRPRVNSAQRTPASQDALTSSPAKVSEAAESPAPAPVESTPAAAAKNGSLAARATRVSVPPPPREAPKDLRPSPSESAYLGESAAVLSATESALPGRQLAGNAMADASLRANLRTLNEFIAECEARLKQNPQDQLTREYLNVAYQQKAELLTAMMDSGRSEH
jgi:hypothetical protein